MTSSRRSRRCSSCGSTLNESALGAAGSPRSSAWPDEGRCAICQLTESLRRIPLAHDDCPRCRSARVLRTTAVNKVGAEMQFCPYCDHIWSRMTAPS